MISILLTEAKLMQTVYCSVQVEHSAQWKFLDVGIKDFYYWNVGN